MFCTELLTRRIDYHILGVTDQMALRALGESRFDAALANMTLSDMAEVEPLFHII